MRDLTALEKRCIQELVYDLYACTENTFCDKGYALKPEDALTDFDYMLDSEIGTDYIWNDIIREEFISDNRWGGVETKHLRYCGKDVIKNYIKSFIEKKFPYSNTSLSETERLELFSKAWMF